MPSFNEEHTITALLRRLEILLSPARDGGTVGSP